MKAAKLIDTRVLVVAVRKGLAVPGHTDPCEQRFSKRGEPVGKLLGRDTLDLGRPRDRWFALHSKLPFHKPQSPLVEQGSNGFGRHTQADHDLGERLALLEASEHERGELASVTGVRAGTHGERHRPRSHAGAVVRDDSREGLMPSNWKNYRAIRVTSGGQSLSGGDDMASYPGGSLPDTLSVTACPARAPTSIRGSRESWRRKIMSPSNENGSSIADSLGDLIEEPTLATHLGVSRATLQSWRYAGRGPRWSKLGRLIRYRRADIDAFLEANTRGKVA